MHLQPLQLALEEMHKTVTQTANSARASAIARHNAKTNVQAVNFSAGDFVLIGCPQPQKQNKLCVTWSGPARVMKLTSPLVAEVQNLISGKVTQVHASRLKFYDNSSLNVTEELTEYLKYQRASLYLVDEIKSLSKVRRKGYKVLVSWVGFPGEDTMEPLLNIYRDVPDRVLGFLNSTLSSNPQAAGALQVCHKAGKGRHTTRKG